MKKIKTKNFWKKKRSCVKFFEVMHNLEKSANPKVLGGLLRCKVQNIVVLATDSCFLICSFSKVPWPVWLQCDLFRRNGRVQPHPDRWRETWRLSDRGAVTIAKMTFSQPPLQSLLSAIAAVKVMGSRWWMAWPLLTLFVSFPAALDCLPIFVPVDFERVLGVLRSW